MLVDLMSQICELIMWIGNSFVCIQYMRSKKPYTRFVPNEIHNALLLFVQFILSTTIDIKIRYPVNGSINILKHEKPKNDFMSFKLHLHEHTRTHAVTPKTLFT